MSKWTSQFKLSLVNSNANAYFTATKLSPLKGD